MNDKAKSLLRKLSNETPDVGIIHYENKSKELVACKTLPKGTKVLTLLAEHKVDNRDRHSIERQDGHYTHPIGKYVNHSCEPNAEFLGKVLVTNKDIHNRQAITFDYHTTESEISNPFKCNCKSVDCRGEIK